METKFIVFVQFRCGEKMVPHTYTNLLEACSAFYMFAQDFTCELCDAEDDQISFEQKGI
jgi:hypothetical protein